MTFIFNNFYFFNRKKKLTIKKMGLKKNKKVMKPVENNGNADSPLQFKVNKEVEKSKKVNAKMVFEPSVNKDKPNKKLKKK